MKKQMIKRADGSYSQRGLWDNIRANRGSGKKPTAQMLKQERKIKANMADGGVNNPGFKALPGYVQAKIRANMQEGGMTGSPIVDIINNQSQMPMMQMGGTMPQTSAGQSVLQEAMAMSKMQDGGKMPNNIARARFMAAANGNVSKARETASKYGYKMQVGGFRSSNPSTSDNTMAPNPAMMQQRIAQGQAIIKKTSTPQGQAQMASAKQRAEANIAATKAKQEQQAAQKAAQAKAKQVADMKARIADSKKVQELPMSEQFTPENIARATQATGDKLRLFGPESPLVTSGLFDVDPNSVIDNYLNPAKFVGDMATNLGQGIQETANTGDFTAVGKAIATPIVAGATMNLLKAPLHSLEKNVVGQLTKGVNNTSVATAMANPTMTAGIGIGAGLIGRGINQSVKQAGRAAEHDAVHRVVAPLSVGEYKKGGYLKNMYSKKYMALGAKAVDTYAADGNDPKFEQYYNQQIQKLNQSGVTKADLPTRNALYDYYKSSSPTSVTDQTGRMMFNSPSAKPLVKSNTYTEAVDPNTGQVAMQPTNLNKEIFNQDVKKFGYGGKAGLKDMYYMKKGGQFPDRYKKMGFSGVDKPKRTTSGGKSHAVVTKVDGNYKLIRFGQAGEVGSPDGTARNKAFKARHAKNIAKGKSSAAYWANKIKWILFIPLMLWQAF